MSKEKKESVWASDWTMIKRALGIIQDISPGILKYNIARDLINAFTPYIAIYMSALIVDELVGNRDIKRLMIYVFITAVSTLTLNIIENLFSKKVNVMNKMFSARFKSYLNNFKLNMDYDKIEDPKYNEIHSKIVGSMFMVNGGISSVVSLVTTIIKNLFSVFIANVLIVTSIYQINSKVSGYGISSLVSLIILIGVISGCIVLTVRNSEIESKKEFDLFLNCATNRYIDYYHYNYMEDDKAAKDIHIFNQRNLIVDEIRDKARKPWMKILLDRSSLIQKYFGANAVMSNFIGGFAYIFVGIRALSGEISLGNVTKSYAAIVSLVAAVGNLFVSLAQIKSNNNYLKVLYEYLDTSQEQQCGSLPLEKNVTDWEIEFHNVSFKYPIAKEYAIRNLTIKISSRTCTAIVGVNGSGKTTMIKLLCGFYQPETGCITLNGKDIKEYDYEEYLQLFSVVFQDFKLLALRIGENIATSKSYDRERVWDSLQSVGLIDKISTLPSNIKEYIYKNFDTEGVDFSGGEEQKLAIARAFYKDSPFVILDEPTAALDPISEYEIYSKFNEIICDKAALYISHRLSSCRFCDRIAVFDGGEIVQLGTHEELIKNEKGKYYELWNAQAMYYQAG